MIARLRARQQALLDHPIVRLELRRIHRKRWWPGRRFFMFYPALLGAGLGYGIVLALSDSPGVQLAAVVTGVPAVCLVTVCAGLLAFTLPWIAPALTAVSIVHEREVGTLDLLRATLLTERSIVLGKLGGCLARMWPGILTLVLLTPFRLVWIGGAGGPVSLTALAELVEQPISTTQIVWLSVAGVVGMLKPFVDLVVHAAVGLFVSVLARSSGVAVAVSYGAVIVLRVSLWLARYLLNVVPMVRRAIMDTSAFAPGNVGMVPALTSSGMVVVELVGAAVLVWGGIWWLKRA
jgi:hypothetical protein